MSEAPDELQGDLRATLEAARSIDGVEAEWFDATHRWLTAQVRLAWRGKTALVFVDNDEIVAVAGAVRSPRPLERGSGANIASSVLLLVWDELPGDDVKLEALASASDAASVLDVCAQLLRDLGRDDIGPVRVLPPQPRFGIEAMSAAELGVESSSRVVRIWHENPTRIWLEFETPDLIASCELWLPMDRATLAGWVAHLLADNAVVYRRWRRPRTVVQVVGRGSRLRIPAWEK